MKAADGLQSWCRDCKSTHAESWHTRMPPEWKIWVAMKARCRARHGAEYKSYRSRGIRVCRRWLNSFDAFYEDMGPRPTANHTLDRIDNTGNYEPANCRWATHEQQSRNKRGFVLTSSMIRRIAWHYGFGNMPQTDIAAHFGIGKRTVYTALRPGAYEREIAIENEGEYEILV